ncbi:MAG: metallophosphoesterase family protein [Bacteroidales bacterium]|nr:metallophosphoesterase family protein [Bacteroidales bacterium]
MKNKTLLFAVLILGYITTLYAQHHQTGDAYTIITNPGEHAQTQIRINWHTDLGNTQSVCTYTKCSDTDWKQAVTIKADQQLCLTFDSLYSKTASNEDFYESARFWRCTVELENLEPATEYMYRVGTDNMSEIRYFKTAPVSGTWSMGIIADIHTYSPLPKRLEAAMEMVGTLERCNGNDLDFMLHVGDVCAWGGSHSFWKTMYAEHYFAKYMWAGVNGNHDDMARGYAKQTNEYFRYVNNNPLNGYEGEEGVCYHFTYDNALFIMLNSEKMREQEGLEVAQEWVKEVITSHPAKYIIVVTHYQWFFGDSGRSAQYERWKELFDEYGVDLAIAGNNHIYVRTNALYQGSETDGTTGTVYIQTPSSDNERGVELNEWTDNTDIIKFRWSEGANTVGAILMRADNDKLHLTLYDRHGNNLDQVTVLAKR